MTPPSLTFTEIEVERLPGFPRGGPHLRGLAGGVNLVYGPNASGKSSTARALLALLWPTGAPPRAILRGRYELGAESFEVQVDHGALTCRREGREAPPPTLPPQAGDRYYLALERLLAADEESRHDAGAMAALIHREAAGGYDLAAAIRAAGFRAGPSSSQVRASKDLRQAEAAVADERNRQQRLLGEEQRLRELIELRRQASAAQERLAVLDSALDHSRAKAQERQAKDRFATFAPGLAKLRGDEKDQLARLRERGEKLEGRRRQAAERLAEERRRLAECGLSLDGLPSGLLGELRSRLETLRNAEQAGRLAAVEVAEARARAGQALARIDPEGDLATWRRQAGPEPARQLAGLLRQAETVRAREALYELALSSLGPLQTPPDLSSLEEGGRLLRRWLAAPALAGPARLLLAAVAGLLAAGALAWGRGLGPWLPALAGLAALVLLLLAWRPGPGAGRRSTYRRDFAATGLEPPSSWRAGAVERRLEELGRQLETGRSWRRKAELWSALGVDEATLRRRREELEAARGEISRRLGLAPDAEHLELAWLADGLRSLHEALSRLTAAEARQEAAEAAERRLAAALAADLAPYGYDRLADRSALVGTVEDLARRQEAFAAARAARDREERLLAEDLEPERQEHAQRLEELFTRLGLAAGDEAALERHLADWDDYRATGEKLRQARRDREAAAAALAARPELLERPAAELEEEQNRCRELADRWQGWHDEIVRIRDRVDQAKQGRGLEAALARRDACREALRSVRAADYEAVAGWALGKHLANLDAGRHRSPVLARARELFARFTRERYELRIEGGNPPGFRAADRVAGDERSLEELSSGTRVQLLLAVRVAFIERQEDGVALPLILDEGLANTDPGRARAVIEALAELAREGRQVIAFTAQPEEAGKWTAVLEGLAAGGRGAAHRSFDLGAAGHLTEARRLPLRVHPPPAGPPPPAGRDHAAYGRLLAVPGVDPRAGDAGGVHLWHLIEDPRLLHRFLSAGFERWGQARGLLEAGGAAVVEGAEEALPAAAAAARALEEALRLGRVGRGRGVDRAALAESGAVSGAFLDGMSTAAERLGGEAHRLLAALEAREAPEVKGFRSSKIADLAAFFADGGYLPRRQCLAPEEIRARTLAAVAGEIRQGLLTVQQVDRLLAWVIDLPCGGRGGQEGEARPDPGPLQNR